MFVGILNDFAENVVPVAVPEVVVAVLPKSDIVKPVPGVELTFLVC